MGFPLFGEIAQRATQRPGRRQTLRRQFKRQLLEFDEVT